MYNICIMLCMNYSLFPSLAYLSITAYYLATTQSSKVKSVKKPPSYSTLYYATISYMHSLHACMNDLLSYGHHSPIMIIVPRLTFVLSGKKEKTKGKVTSFGEKKNAFSSTFTLIHNLSLLSYFFFFF